jgi:thiol-disulfide isomerase/thioredoxin
MKTFSSLSLTLMIAPLLLAGCVVDPDPDGDFLTTEFEESIGTDPENADSDGDGFEDGEEYVNYFSPSNYEDFPYTNADYPRGPLPDSDAWSALREAADADEEIGRGWDAGEFTKSFAGVDQYGDTLLLKRFYGEVLLIDISAEWCPPCRAAALTFEQEWQHLVGEGVMFFTVLGDGLSDGTNDADADRWSQWPTGEYNDGAHPYGHPSNYGGEVGPAITSAILEDGLADDTAQEVSRPWLDQTNAYPSFILIDRNHVITTVQGGGGGDTMEVVAEMAAQERPEVDYPLPENVDEVREAFPGAGSAN